MIIPLSIPSIRYAVELCEEKPGYHFGIIIADDTYVESIFDICLDFIDWMQYNPIHTVKRTDTATIAFKNGSYIQILRPSDTRRCLLWHACLTDPKLDKKAAHKTSAKYLRLTYKDISQGRGRNIRGMKECFDSIFDNIITKILLCILAVLIALGAACGLTLLWVLWLANYTTSCLIVTFSIMGITLFAELVYLAYIVFFDE